MFECFFLVLVLVHVFAVYSSELQFVQLILCQVAVSISLLFQTLSVRESAANNSQFHRSFLLIVFELFSWIYVVFTSP